MTEGSISSWFVILVHIYKKPLHTTPQQYDLKSDYIWLYAVLPGVIFACVVQRKIIDCHIKLSVHLLKE